MTFPASQRRTALRKLPMAILLAATLAGCAVQPEPILQAERSKRAAEDVSTLFKDMEPVNGDISLHEAFARALKYNYDYRLRSMERTMAEAQLNVANYDMLPRLTAAAGAVRARSRPARARHPRLARWRQPGSGSPRSRRRCRC